MELDNKNVTSFPIDFSGENTFFSTPGDCLDNFINNFPNIDSDGNTVVITDRYLFSPGDETYKNSVIRALTSFKASKICYCSHRRPNTTFFNEISNALDNCILEYRRISKYHDRHWYCIESNQGFLSGASLNGIGKEVCSIEPLSNETCNDLKKFLVHEGIIPSE